MNTVEQPPPVIHPLEILGVRIHATNLDLTSGQIAEWIRQRHRTYVCIAPVATIVDCQKDSRYKEIINGAGMTTPDGMPLVWLGQSQKNQTIRRTYGPDLMERLCRDGEIAGYRHYFYGGSPEALEGLTATLKRRFPGIQIVGQYSPPIRDIGFQETPETIEAINRAQPDILWVGLGSPKQDYWMHDHRAVLDVPVMIGVGAAFDFLAGTKVQAPRWMRDAGLEWFFRLCCEPRRLWKRYLIGNAQFLALLIKDTMKG